jgi:hypothetical protein
MPSTIRRLDSLSLAFRAAWKRRILWPIAAILLLAAPSGAQQAPQRRNNRPEPPPSEQAAPQARDQAPLTLPPGTSLALVLTHPLDSKAVHRGDTVFAQITDPVLADNQVAIPAGAPVQGKVEKLSRQGSHAEVLLQSASIAFPDGYVVNVSGPLEIKGGEGTAWRNPSDGAKAGAILAPFVGSGLGTAIGVAAHTTQTTSFGGMTMTSSTPKGMAIGSITGLAAGTIVSVVLLARSHSFYVGEGAPLEMVLPRAVTLARGPAGDATSASAAQP